MFFSQEKNPKEGKGVRNRTQNSKIPANMHIPKTLANAAHILPEI